MLVRGKFETIVGAWHRRSPAIARSVANNPNTADTAQAGVVCSAPQAYRPLICRHKPAMPSAALATQVSQRWLDVHQGAAAGIIQIALIRFFEP